MTHRLSVFSVTGAVVVALGIVLGSATCAKQSSSNTVTFSLKDQHAVVFQVVSVTASAPVLTPGNSYVLSWIDDNTGAARTSEAIATTPSVLVLMSPDFLPGNYTVRVHFGGRVGHFAIELGVPPAIADPNAVLSSYQIVVAQALVDLTAVAQAETDPILQAALFADIATINHHHQLLADALQAASPAEVAAVALLFQANGLTSELLAANQDGRESLLSATTTAVLSGVAKVGIGIGLVEAGISFGVITPMGAACTASGLLLIVRGFDNLWTGIRINFKPTGPLDVNQVISPEQLGGANYLSLSSGMPVQLVTTASLASLSAVDQRSTSPEVRYVCRAIDSVQNSFGQMGSYLLGLIASRPPEVPMVASTIPAVLNSANLAITNQTNHQIQVSLASGVLTATAPYATDATTNVMFSYDADPLESLATSAIVRVVNQCDPWTSLTGVAVLPGDLGPYHRIDFENETEPTAVPLNQLRLGSDSVDAFHVDLQCYGSSGAMGGFWLMDTSGSNNCFAVSPSTIGETINYVDSVALTPSVPIRAFGGYFAIPTFLGSDWNLVAIDCIGRQWAVPLAAPGCACDTNPTCSNINRWIGFRFSQPIVRIELRVSYVGTYRFLVIDDLLWEDLGD